MIPALATSTMRGEKRERETRERGPMGTRRVGDWVRCGRGVESEEGEGVIFEPIYLHPLPPSFDPPPTRINAYLSRAASSPAERGGRKERALSVLRPDKSPPRKNNESTLFMLTRHRRSNRPVQRRPDLFLSPSRSLLPEAAFPTRHRH